MNYHIISGKLSSDTNSISITNRSFRYADGLFESMFFTNNKIAFSARHLQRLYLGMETLRIELHPLLCIEKIEEGCRLLMAKNQISSSARVRLQVYRNAEGFYLPSSNKSEFLLEVFPLDRVKYKHNAAGLKIGIARSISKEASPLSQLKTTAKQEMIIAALEAQDKRWDDALICNSKGNIVESTNANLFIIKNNQLISPPLSDGPLNGIMRQNIIKIAPRLGLSFKAISLSPQDLLNADEIFLSNAIVGIKWVSQLQSKSFSSKISSTILMECNKLL